MPIEAVSLRWEDGARLRIRLFADRDHVRVLLVPYGRIEHRLRDVSSNIVAGFFHRLDDVRIKRPRGDSGAVDVELVRADLGFTNSSYG